MVVEIGLILYILIGILIFTIYREDIKRHANKVQANGFIKRIIYIVVFLTSLLAWPLLIGA